MGFNLGATKFKQHHKGAVRRHYFESPLVRLVKDFGYRDVYSDGAYMPSDRNLCPRPILIYRYYDGQFYDELDEDEDGLPPIRPKRKPDKDQVFGRRRDIEDFAAGLGKLILKVRKRYLDSVDVSPELKKTFKFHLVGHSMGGANHSQLPAAHRARGAKGARAIHAGLGETIQGGENSR